MQTYKFRTLRASPPRSQGFFVCLPGIGSAAVIVHIATRFVQEVTIRKLVQGVGTSETYIFPGILGRSSKCNAFLSADSEFRDKYGCL